MVWLIFAESILFLPINLKESYGMVFLVGSLLWETLQDGILCSSSIWCVCENIWDQKCTS